VIALLQLLWPVLVLLHLPAVLNTIAVVMFRRIAHTHDWEHADDLPQTAGDWLRDRAAVYGLRVIVTDEPEQADAYHHDRRVIHLSPKTHFKSDAVFWAIAAHELGHARIYAVHPLLGSLGRVAGWLKQYFLLFGTGLAFGSVLYARPRLDLAFAVFASSLVLYVIDAIEEAYASYLAHRELRASAHLTPVLLRVVRRTLLAALGTYLSVVVAGVVLLSQWSIVEKIAGDGWLGEIGALTTVGWVVVIALCVLGLAHAFVQLRVPVALPLVGLVWRVLLVILIVLVWDLSATSAWAWCVILAIIAAQRLIVGLLMLPGIIPLLVAMTWLRKLSGPGHHASAEYSASHAAGKPLIRTGNRALLEILETRVRNPSLVSRVYALTRLFYLPLIVAIGGGLIT